MSQYGYGGNANPFDQRGGGGGGANPPYPTSQPNYGRQQYNNGRAMGRDDYGGQNVEMAPLAQNGQQFGRQATNSILNQSQDISDGIDQMDAKFDRLGAIQKRFLNAVSDAEVDSSRAELDSKTDEIKASYEVLIRKMKAIKQNPESKTYMKHVSSVERKLKDSFQRYQTFEAAYRAKSKEQDARQYLIAHPDATESEVRQAVDNLGGQQIFAQAIAQSGRRTQASSALRATQSRHEEIQKIEQQMIELAELFNQMDALVVQQEAAVTNIEMRGEEVVENMGKGTEEIGTAIESARNTRKWKWWCLGICVMIIIVIVIVILIYKFVIAPAPAAAANAVRPNAKRYVLPGTPWQPVNTMSEPVVPGKAWYPPIGRRLAFRG